MKLIVGLGNPGEEYKHTRHNIGAKVVKMLADSSGISLRRRRYFSSFGEGKIAGENIVIIQPMTYMNLSGQAVLAVFKDKGIPLDDILVVCDDADLGLGEIRMRPSGSDGGHRGLRSIIESLGSSSFTRLRIGIGSASGRKKGGLKDHVLSPFNKDEAKRLKEAEEKACDAALYWLKNGVVKTMNKYNAKALE